MIKLQGRFVIEHRSGSDLPAAAGIVQVHVVVGPAPTAVPSLATPSRTVNPKKQEQSRGRGDELVHVASREADTL
jgi:hypothetical protein